MPVPVLIAVGHTNDRYVLDDVARYSCKTPTDAAYVLVQEVESRESQVVSLWQDIQKNCQTEFVRMRQTLDVMRDRIDQLVLQRYQTIRFMLDTLYDSIMSYDPAHMRQLGYATLHTPDGMYLQKGDIMALSQ